ncbi:uncharacterized protein LOC100677819 isoform X1 [Nasonia vitripennis]|uniref:Uncharacterized protein n=1 Tax=Nasonia vitripennis TaxID=7425 RepID=A0A7M7TCU8_NASVI|nr:uncharacterized protein LOC100677819 isoform X1 [Nasonia vitripennis]
MAVCKNIESLLKAKQVSWSEEIYSNIVDLATLHLTSLDKTVRETYGHLLMNIPLNIVIPKLNKAGLLSDDKKFRNIQNYSCESLILAQRLHMRSNNGEMQAQHFKTYMAFLLLEYYFDAFGLSEVFILCWPTISDNETIAKMYELALANRTFLFFWGGFEAAQHSVPPWVNLRKLSQLLKAFSGHWRVRFPVQLKFLKKINAVSTTRCTSIRESDNWSSFWSILSALFIMQLRAALSLYCRTPSLYARSSIPTDQRAKNG